MTESKDDPHTELDVYVHTDYPNEESGPSEVEQIQHSKTKKLRLNRRRKVIGVASGLICNFLSDGFVTHLSVLYLELQDEFQKSWAETAVVQSVASGTYFMGGIFAGLLVTRFGLFKTGLLGATLEFLGLTISYFSPNIPFLVVSLGLVTGFGCSIIYIFGNAITAGNFEGTGKVLAICFASLGSGAGSMTYAYIIDYLSQEYGWRGAILILAGVISHLFIVVLLCAIYNSDGKDKDKTEISKNHMTFTVFTQVLRNKMFISYMVVTGLAIGVLATMLIFHVDYFNQNGYSRSESVFFYFIMSLSSTVTRPAPGLLAKIPHVGTFVVQGLATFIGATGYGLLPVAGSYAFSMSLNVMVGVYLGFLGALLGAGPAKLLEKDHYPLGLGMILTIVGITTTAGGPLGGLVKDVTGSYDWLYHGVGIFLAVCGTFMFLFSVIRRTQRGSN